MIIGLSGNRCVGKDSFFNILSSKLNSSVKRYAFADVLKNDLYVLLYTKFRINVFIPTSEEKEIIRPMLIGYGSAWRNIDIDHWVKITVDNIEYDLKHNENIIPVIVDIRFENELEYIREKYGKDLIHIHIDRYDAIVPTFEEMHNIDAVSDKANFYIKWGHNSEEGMYQIIKNIYDNIYDNI